MPLTDAKCPNCGHALTVDSSKDAAICEFCGSAFIVEKAINYNNSYNQYQIEHADIQISDDRSAEAKLRNAEVFFSQLGQPDKAISIFKEVTELAPGDYRGWWGVARVMTDEFTITACGTEQFGKIRYYATNAIRVAGPDKKDELVRIWDGFEANINGFLTKKNEGIAQLEAQLDALRSEYDNNKAELDRVQHVMDLASASQFSYKTRESIRNIGIFGIILAVIFFFCISSGNTALFVTLSIVALIIGVGLLVVVNRDRTRVERTSRMLDYPGCQSRVEDGKQRIAELEARIRSAKDDLKQGNLNE